VVYLPNFSDSAFTRAREEARKNGYVTNAARNVTVTPALVPGTNYQPGKCIQIFAEGTMPLYNYLSAGPSLIPLGFIPTDYSGKTIHVDLYDPGDVDSVAVGPTTLQDTFGCLAPTSGSSPAHTPRTAPANSMEVLTPAGDLQCAGTTPDTNHVDGHSNTLGPNLQPGSLPYNFFTLNATNYNTVGLTQEQAAQPLDVGNGDGSDGENPKQLYIQWNLGSHVY